MPRPLQEVRVYTVQNRRGDRSRTRPHLVRWTIDGRHRSKAFRTKAEAERYRGALLQAVQMGNRFDVGTGEPDGWHVPLADIGLHEWVRRWLAEQWPEWQPRTRTSATEALARFTTLAVRPPATAPRDLRRYLQGALRPDDACRDAHLERWLDRQVMTLDELEPPVVGELDRKLGLRLGGAPLAATTANRYRTTAHACIRAAADAGALAADPWPPRSRSRARRKINRSTHTLAIRSLPDPDTMARALDALLTHQPASRRYRAMTAVAYYAGLRPSEVIMLRVGALTLPDQGWGRIAVTEADIDVDEPGAPKTGPRAVPMPPTLVAILREWLTELAPTTPDALLFRTRHDNRPNQANWRRAWHRALASIGQEPIRLYDCRHAAATTWLAAGVPLGECAKRLGHSVDTLVSTYVGALTDDEHVGNARIEAVLNRVLS